MCLIFHIEARCLIYSLVKAFTMIVYNYRASCIYMASMALPRLYESETFAMNPKHSLYMHISMALAGVGRSLYESKALIHYTEFHGTSG